MAGIEFTTNHSKYGESQRSYILKEGYIWIVSSTKRGIKKEEEEERESVGGGGGRIF